MIEKNKYSILALFMVDSLQYKVKFGHWNVNNPNSNSNGTFEKGTHSLKCKSV